MSHRNIPHSGKLQNLWDNDLKWEAPIEKTSPVFRHSKHSKHLIARGSVYSTYFTTVIFIHLGELTVNFCSKHHELLMLGVEHFYP